MAEQDRFGGWFGRKSSAPSGEDVAKKVLNAQGSGAEQDRLGAHFSGKAPSADDVARKLPGGSGAEQDIYGSHLADKIPLPSAKDITDRLPSAKDITDRMPNPKASGAEQDIYGSHLSDKLPSGKQIVDKLPGGSGAEQDRYGGWFGGKNIPTEKVTDNLPQGSGAEQDRLGRWFGGKDIPTEKISNKLPRTSGAEQDRYGSHFGLNPTSPINTSFVGLLQSSVLPSFGLNAGLSTIVYGIARYTNRAEGKDWLWPTGMTANAWWSAIGTKVVYDGLSVSQAWSRLNYTEKLLLTGVSAWGLRLFYRVATRSVRRGKDDARYEAVKQEPGFWNKALFTMFLPEAVAQALISLPFTLPFRAPLESTAASPAFGSDNSSLLQGLAVFLFSSGYALEVLADAQLESHKRENPSQLNREGVWSIVRHPNYLGDALIHASFPVLLLGSGLLHPLTLLGPVVNYVFLRYVGGDRENEASQEERYVKENPLKAADFEDYRREKNSFWPAVAEASNQWTWIVAAIGAGAVVVERGLRAAL